jgi:molybdopterin molybdotransferase
MSGPSRRLLDDCFLHDKDRLRHGEALALLAERLVPITGAETVELQAAHRRVLAQAVTALRDVPAFDNAAVDGYALAHHSLSAEAATRLDVSARIAAGVARQEMLATGTAARIFTGAAMPRGADTVVMQEDVDTQTKGDGTVAVIPPGVRAGANVRKAGEDQTAGSVVVEAGTRLRPQELAAIASTGLDRIACRERLRVALVSTGDEIVRPGTPIATGQVYDSNHFLLRALIETVDAEVHDMGVLEDDARAVAAALRDAAGRCHVILTTGGASRGEEDHVVETIARDGTLHAWQLAIKPGRPLAFGRLGDAVFLGLPGNPVAAMVCFLLYAQPMFAHLQGARWREPVRYPLPAGFSIARKKPDRREFLRGWVDAGKAGPRLMRFARDGSGLISSLTAADGLIEIDEATACVEEGQMLGFIPFSGFGLTAKS